MDELANAKVEREKIAMTIGPNDHEDGIYVGMKEEEYHRDSALGASGIVDLNISPLAFWKNSAWNPKKYGDDEDPKETDATIRGTYFHEALAGGKPSVIVKPAGMSFATKEGKDFKAMHPGATFIKAEDTERAQDMINAMRETGVLERIGGIGGGISELSVFWTDSAGRRRKFRIDRLYNGEAYDWKTMANKMNKDLETLVAHTVAEHRYHVKAYWYQQGLQVMKKMIQAKGPAAFKTGGNEKFYAEMKALSDHESIVPFWYVFVENSGVPNIVARRFVSHDASNQLNAYFRGAKQEVERALATFDTFMRSHGPAAPWYGEVHWKNFDDQDFTAARWILPKTEAMASKRRQKVAMSGGLLCHYCGFQTWLTAQQKGAVRLTFPKKIAPGRHEKRALAARMFTVDHVEAQARGGSNAPENTVPACQLCNMMKGNAPADQFRILIAYMKRNEVHPHQIFQRTGIWFVAEYIDPQHIRKPDNASRAHKQTDDQ